MAQKKKQWVAIIMMFFLFAMIAFVTNLCSPMAVIVKNQFHASSFAAQLGNAANFIAYLVMGIPSGMLLHKLGYKKTALLAIAIGILGVFIQYMSGWEGIESFWVYLLGAFIAGFCMCMLNTVVNPMLNTMGGGGNKGNQLVQFGGVCNSLAAVAVTIIMGSLIADAAHAAIEDATPALMIALIIFAVAFVVLLFTKIEEPVMEEEDEDEAKKAEPAKISGALKYRHFTLGIIAIFLYLGLEVGPPTYAMQYLTADTEEMIAKKEAVLNVYKDKSPMEAAIAYHQLSPNFESVMSKKDTPNLSRADSLAIVDLEDDIASTAEKIENGQLTPDKVKDEEPGVMMNATIAGGIVAIYWFLMLIGRLLGGVIGAKVSSRKQVTFCATMAIIFVLLGILLPKDLTFNMPGIDWKTMSVVWGETPVGIIFIVLVGLFTSVMWGGIFNMSVEGLGKYTSLASGLFMTMVFGGGILVPFQGFVADMFNSYMISYVVVIFCAAYILFYALVGSRLSKKVKAEAE